SSHLAPSAPEAAAADLSPRLRAQVLAPACPRRATPLDTSVLDFGPPRLRRFRLGAGRAAQPRVLTTPRDLPALTQAMDLARGGLRGKPRVLSGSWCATDAAALLQMSRSSCKRAFACRRCWSASDRGAAWPSCAWRSARCYCPIQGWSVLSCTPRS